LLVLLAAVLGAVLISDISGRGARVATRAPSTAPPTTTPVDRSLALVGDSLSAQALAQQTAQLHRAGWEPVVINALAGRRILPDDDSHPTFSGIAAIGEIRAANDDPHTWVVELGTNDVAVTHNDAPAMRARIAAMLNAIGPGHRIVWVNVHNGFDVPSSTTFNRVLAEVAAARDDMVVANWAAEATHPGNLVYDQVHLTPTGTVTFAELITAAVERAEVDLD
jgi:hypothetical protein